MLCLEDLIGIDGVCSVTAPKSGLLLNQLPGISIDTAAAGMDQEQQSAVTLIESKIDLAEQNIAQDIRTFIEPQMKSRSIIENDTAGKLQENSIEIATSANLRGLMIEIDSDSYLSLYINSISLTWPSTITTNIQIFDLMNQIPLNSFPITTKIDPATQPAIIYPNVKYTTGKQKMQIAIITDANLSTSIKTTLTNNCGTCNTLTYIKPFGRQYVKFSGISIPYGGPFIKSSTTPVNDTCGISINYSLSCDVEPFICNMADSLAYPLRLKAAVNILDELRVGGINGRINSIVTVNSDEVLELRNEFEDQYQLSMNQILDNLSVNDDLCFSCNKRVKYKYASL